MKIKQGQKVMGIRGKDLPHGGPGPIKVSMNEIQVSTSLHSFLDSLMENLHL